MKEDAMNTTEAIRNFYAQPALLTSAARYAARVADLPNSVDELVHIIKGLGIYDVVAADFYGVTLPAARHSEIHLRAFEKMLERLLALNDQPLTVARAAERRFAFRWHPLHTLLGPLLLAQGAPARPV